MDIVVTFCDFNDEMPLYMYMQRMFSKEVSNGPIHLATTYEPAHHTYTNTWHFYTYMCAFYVARYAI